MAAFEEIYQTYFYDVYLYALKLSSDPSLAEEITSQTFFKALKSIDSFRGDCALRIWLCQIAKNTFFTHQKRQNRHTSLSDADMNALVDPADIPEDRLVHQSQATALYQHLQQLPDPYKIVFMLRVFNEWDFLRIGSLFNKTQNWACVTYHRARKKLRDQMDEED